jgi:hypothetical protein
LGSLISLRLSSLYAAALLALAGCTADQSPAVKTSDAGSTLSILAAATHKADGWRILPLKRRTIYSVVKSDGRSAIMAVGRKSASGLARHVNIDPRACRTLRWSWRVDQMQSTVNLRKKSGEDVAASLFITFGDPGFMMLPNPVPTLRYVWTTEHMQKGEIFDNPFRPKIIRTIVAENRSDRLGEWVDFERDLYADYLAAFGKPPGDTIQLVSIFTDNDQSKEPVKVYYGPITVHCSA